ncbi:similar to Ikzf5 [Actinidia rufa]|uniref:Similar to Ikzf5 n=1 Tax=Actinidia rufa TaxID=165716 RepID=A0A7J0GI57_9ERIC|nr:similar to Ikzf5 [Actinidia rufa]
MEKTLQWLVPVATNTSNNEFSKKGDTCNSVIRLQTLYHADKQKTDQYILELATWLHLLISAVRQRDNGIRVFPTRSPTRKGLTMQPKSNHRRTHSNVKLSPEDRKLLEKVLSRKKLAPGISKSQEFALVKKGGSKVWALSRSTGNSPNQQLQHPKFCDLDVLDGLDTTF